MKPTAFALAACLAVVALDARLAGATDPVAPGGTGPARTSAGARPAPGAAAHPTSISGVASNPDGTPIPGARVRLRNVVTGKIAATTTSNAMGEFSFTGVEPGSYLIELVSESGKILAVGHTFTVAAGENVTTVVKMGAKLSWFSGLFGNAASAIAATAAAAGVTAIAPEAKPCSSPSPGCS